MYCSSKIVNHISCNNFGSSFLLRKSNHLCFRTENTDPADRLENDQESELISKNRNQFLIMDNRLKKPGFLGPIKPIFHLGDKNLKKQIDSLEDIEMQLKWRLCLIRQNYDCSVYLMADSH